MQLNHVNVPVTDTGAASAFLEEYFDFRHVGGEGNVVALAGEGGVVLGLTPIGPDATVPRNLHVGFFVDDRATVDDLHHRLEADGFDVGSVSTRHHVYDFYVEGPGDLRIEIGAPLRG